ncbi:MAG: FAD-dependent oxidoreductase [Calditrichaeota bacterium]|nr:FAD-dependent oxidoreductase [Calditrichota bacterium]
MKKPIILTVDDELEVSNAIERDLRSQFGRNYKIIRTNSGREALETIRQLKKRNDPIALFLTDQRMPEMEGTEFLEEAAKIYPTARKVLLTAYADTNAAITAINKIGLDHYLMKPWDPPEEKLYPVLTDLLQSWHISNPSPFEGIRVVGMPWDPASFHVKDFLARNNIPYQWFDIEANPESKNLLDIQEDLNASLPSLLFPDGTTLKKPEIREIAEKAGLQTIASGDLYDLIIIGAGPAGLAAAVYSASEGLKTLVVEEQAPGGQAGMSSRIENYLGFPVGLSGSELTHRAVTQARRFGVEILTPQKAVEIKANGPSKKVVLQDGSELLGRSILIATGVSYRTLKAKGLEDFTGAGVYYGASMSEGPAVKDKDIIIVGGANSAGQAAMYFSRFAKTVTIIIRSDSISKSMSHYLVDQIEATSNIKIRVKTEIIEAIGSNKLETIKLRDRQQNIEETLDLNMVFIFIGAFPHTDWLGENIARDSNGFILCGSHIQAHEKFRNISIGERTPYLLETSIPGIFAAGDVRHGSVKRVASSVGEGSMAVMFVHQYLNTI